MEEEQSTQFQETSHSVERLQRVDTRELARVEDLGRDLSFEDALEPANRLVRLFNQLPPATLEDLPENHLQKIRQQSDGIYSLFSEILEFSPKQENPHRVRDQIIEKLDNAYTNAFNALFPYISYGVSKTVDFARLEQQARASAQAIEDRGRALADQLAEHQKNAEGILERVRQVASEQGVSQQAHYFKDEADLHKKQADAWRTLTYLSSGALALYALASLFLYSWLTPATTLEAVQLVTGKILLFAVIAFLVLLCSKNFLSHTHNQIVNRHRQNALLTFQALSDAAAEGASRDVILTHAAACIFAPQDTGYSRSSGSSTSGSKQIVELLPRSTMSID